MKQVWISDNAYLKLLKSKVSRVEGEDPASFRVLIDEVLGVDDEDH